MLSRRVPIAARIRHGPGEGIQQVTNRRDALGALAAAMAWVPSVARGQTASGPTRIGIVHPASVEASAVYTALLTGLAERGYLPGNFEVHSDTDIIFTVITRLEIRKLKDVVYETDPAAFVFASVIKEASGGILKKRKVHEANRKLSNRKTH